MKPLTPFIHFTLGASVGAAAMLCLNLQQTKISAPSAKSSRYPVPGERQVTTPVFNAPMRAQEELREVSSRTKMGTHTQSQTKAQ